MTRQRVLEDGVTGAISYVVGLVVLFAWPDRRSVSPQTILFVGIAIILMSSIAINWLAFRRKPGFGLGLRPWRYSVPSFFGMTAATLYINTVWNSQDSDRGLIAYAVCIPLVAFGVIASNYLWAHATGSRTG
jgi:hypothetical protein